MFNLSIKKDIMPYDFYTPETISKRYNSINKALKFINIKDHNQFIKHIDEWNLRKDEDTFDIIEYSRRYCEIDCDVLEQGYNIFKHWMLFEVNIDIDQTLTIVSLAHQFFINKGCYEDVYEISETPKCSFKKQLLEVGSYVRITKN